MAKLHVLVVYGTRPEVIKLAPVIAECLRRPDAISVTVCFTGQHRELVRPIAEYFQICPNIDLALMEPGQSLARMTARMLQELDQVIERARPDCMVAQGDTTTVLCAALSAFYRRIPLVHVEAGLRSGDMNTPWPEEFNRRITTLATTLHCAPTQQAVENLFAEGVPSTRIYLTGNTIIDALMQTVERERMNEETWRQKYSMLGDFRTVLITGHRRENHGDGIRAICAAIDVLAAKFKNVQFVYPVHLNPQVHRPVTKLLADRPNIHLIPPVTYPEFVWLMNRSTLIITDSGGVQEEAPSLGKPVLITRESTERPETIEFGFATLVGNRTDAIVSETAQLLEGRKTIPSSKQNPFGDGRAAERIVGWMIERLSGGG